MSKAKWVKFPFDGVGSGDVFIDLNSITSISFRYADISWDGEYARLWGPELRIDSHEFNNKKAHEACDILIENGFFDPRRKSEPYFENKNLEEV